MKLKKVIVGMMLVTFAAFTACGKTGDSNSGNDTETTEASAPSSSSTFDVSSLKTLGDVFGKESGEGQSVYSDTEYVYVTNIEGTDFRFRANLSSEINEKINSFDNMKEDYNDKVREAVSSLEIVKSENLTELAPSQDEIDKYIGKNGEDLANDGWIVWDYNLETLEYGMEYQGYAYRVTFDGKVDDVENADGEEVYKPFKVKTITYDGVGNSAADF